MKLGAASGEPLFRELEPGGRMAAGAGCPAPGCMSSPPATDAGLRHTGAVMSGDSPLVHSDPEILGGTSVFVGTRVPAQSLFDYLESGDTLDEFLRQFPSSDVNRRSRLLRSHAGRC